LTILAVFDLAAYLPEALKPQFETLKTTILSWLGAGKAKQEADNEGATSCSVTHGISILAYLHSSTTALTRARAALSDAERSLSDTQRTYDDAKKDISELFASQHLGAQGQWRKLKGTCLAKDTGEYTYEVCLFDEARQKPNKPGQTFSLG
jgi:protein kinase C substrate 80K-H